MKWEIYFGIFCSALLFISYLNGGDTNRIKLPATPPDTIKSSSKFWVDHETVEFAESLGLKGAAAFLVQNLYGARFSVIAFPNGFVQMRNSREETLETIKEVKRGIDAKRR